MYYFDSLSFLILLVTHFRNFRQTQDSEEEDKETDDQTSPTDDCTGSPHSLVGRKRYEVVTFSRDPSQVTIQEDADDDDVSSRSVDADNGGTSTNNLRDDLLLNKHNRTMSLTENKDEFEVDLRDTFSGMLRENKKRKTQNFGLLHEFGTSERQISVNTFDK